VRREPASQLADDPKPVGRLVTRIVQGVRHEDAHRVVGLLRDHETAALQEGEEVGNERGIIHTDAHGFSIGTYLTAGNSTKAQPH
jgi:hypothetical protein